MHNKGSSPELRSSLSPSCWTWLPSPDALADQTAPASLTAATASVAAAPSNAASDAAAPSNAASAAAAAAAVEGALAATAAVARAAAGLDAALADGLLASPAGSWAWTAGLAAVGFAAVVIDALLTSPCTIAANISSLKAIRSTGSIFMLVACLTMEWLCQGTLWSVCKICCFWQLCSAYASGTIMEPARAVCAFGVIENVLLVLLEHQLGPGQSIGKEVCLCFCAKRHEAMDNVCCYHTSRLADFARLASKVA